MIDAEKSDLFDVLASIGFRIPAITREERVEMSRSGMFDHYSNKEQNFLDFVLSHYVAQGVAEVDQDKLPSLLDLKYQSVGDAVVELGSVSEILKVFIGFQEYLYVQPDNT